MTSALKRGLKVALAHALFWSGALQLWKRVALRGKAVVLMYHRVLPDDEVGHTWSHPAIVVRRSTFERHMRFLRRAFTVVSVAEFTDRLERGEPFADATCLVTFDDGWRDNYTDAWPVLSQHGVPAVVFLAIDFIGSDRTFWQEQMGELLHRIWLRARADPPFAAAATAVLEPGGLAGVLAHDEAGARQGILDAVRNLKTDAAFSPGAFIDRLAALIADSQAPASIDRFVAWDEVRRMEAGGVTFGGHGLRHRVLTRLSREDAHEEIAGTWSVLRRELAGRSDSFAYPNGDHDAEVSALVAGTGFRVAFTTASGFVSAGDDPHRVRRVNIHDDVTSTTPMFFARLLRLL